MVLIPAGLAYQLLVRGTFTTRTSDQNFRTLYGFMYNRYAFMACIVMAETTGSCAAS